MVEHCHFEDRILEDNKMAKGLISIETLMVKHI